MEKVFDDKAFVIVDGAKAVYLVSVDPPSITRLTRAELCEFLARTGSVDLDGDIESLAAQFAFWGNLEEAFGKANLALARDVRTRSAELAASHGDRNGQMVLAAFAVQGPTHVSFGRGKRSRPVD